MPDGHSAIRLSGSRLSASQQSRRDGAIGFQKISLSDCLNIQQGNGNGEDGGNENTVVRWPTIEPARLDRFQPDAQRGQAKSGRLHLKTFSITERVKTQFRAELFNAIRPFRAPTNIGFVSSQSICPMRRRRARFSELIHEKSPARMLLAVGLAAPKARNTEEERLLPALHAMNRKAC